MSGAVAGLVNEVVDLVASWGATAHPTSGAVFEALERYESDRPLLILREAIEEIPQEMLDAKLRAEIADLHRAFAGGASGVGRKEETRDRMKAVVSKLGSCLQWHGEEVGRDLGVWLPALDGSERERSLSGLWRSESATDLRGSISSLKELARIRSGIDLARDRVTHEVQAAVDSGTLDGPTLEKLHAALQSDDPAALASAAGLVGSLGVRTGAMETRAALSDAEQQLAQLCERGRSKMKEAGLDGARRGLLDSVLSAAETAIQDSDPDSGDNGQGRLDSLRSWEASLVVLLESDGDIKSAKAQLEAAEVLLERVTREREASSEVSGMDLLQVEQQLRRALKEDAVSLVDPIVRASGILRVHYETKRSALDGPTRELRESARELGDVIEAHSNHVLTERLANARLLLDGVDAVVASGQLDALKPLNERIHEEIEEIREEADRSKRQRKGRGEIERRRMLEQIEPLIEVARGSKATRLKTLREDVRKTDDPQALEPRFRKVTAPIANGIRDEASQIAHKLEQRGNDSRVVELREALEDDDLVAMTQLSDQLRGRAYGRFRLTASRVMIAISVLALGGIAGYYFYWQGQLGSSHEFQVHVKGFAEMNTDVEVTLVHDGSLGESQRVGGAGLATFRLKPGRYEVFVDERYTGHVFEVPGTTEQPLVIPYPTGAAAHN